MLVVSVAEVGLITPPIGMNLFVLQGVVPGLGAQTMVRGVVPFLLADLVRIGLLVAFPALALWLPGLGNYWLTTTKDTALLAVVGFTELTLATRQAAGSTKHYMTFFLAAGVIYLALSIVSGIIIKLIEQRYRRGMVGHA